MERAHNPSPKETASLKRKIASVGLSTAMLLGMASDVAPTPHQRIIEKTLEKYVPTDKLGNPVVIGPEHTIILPPQEATKAIDHVALISNKAELEAAGQWCDVPNVPLFQKVTPEQLRSAGETVMALEYDDYLKDEKAIEAAKTQEAVETIIHDTYAKAGIEVTFDATKDNVIVKDDEIKWSPADKLASDKQGMLHQLQALTYLPKAALVNDPPTIDFIRADHIILQDKDDQGNTVMKPVGGYFSSNKNQIVLNWKSSIITNLHEMGHKIQDTACDGRPDGELAMTHAQGVSEIHTDPHVKPVYDKLPKGKDGKTWSVFDDSWKMRKLTSFPTGYSEVGDESNSSSAPGEYFAETFARTLIEGQLPTDEKEQLPIAKTLEQEEVERMAEAMPGVDVASLISAQAAYNEQYNGRVPAAFLAKHHVALIDRAFAVTYGVHGKGVNLVPAIHLVSSDGRMDSYIYAYESDRVQEPTGIVYSGTGTYTIDLLNSGSQKLDDALVQNSIDYFQEMAERKGITLSYLITHAEDGNRIDASYEHDGFTTGKPEIRREDLAPEGPYAKGGVVLGPGG